MGNAHFVLRVQRVRPSEMQTIHPDNTEFRIVEIFESLQGEGYNTGMSAVFVRLGKCNLACA